MNDLPDILREMSRQLTRMADSLEGYRDQLKPLSTPKVYTVLNAVAQVWYTSTVALLGRCRFKGVAEARFASYYLLRNNGCPMTLMEIGKAFGRDHSSVAHGLRRANGLKRIDQNYAAMLNRAEQLTHE